MAFVGFFVEYSTANLHRWGCKKKKEGEYKSNDALTNDEDSLITKLSIAAYQVAMGVVEYHLDRDEAYGMPQLEFFVCCKTIRPFGPLIQSSIFEIFNSRNAHCNSFGHACYSNWQPLSLFKL